MEVNEIVSETHAAEDLITFYLLQKITKWCSSALGTFALVRQKRKSTS